MKALIAVGAALVSLVVPSPAEAADQPEEDRLYQLVSELRAQQGLGPLARHGELDRKAEAWAATMAQAGRISHSNLRDGITADWRGLGENVGMGGDAEHVHQALVASAPHYANLTNPEFSPVGVGVAFAPGGTIYVAEVFMTLAPGPAPVPAAPAPPSVVVNPQTVPVSGPPPVPARVPAPRRLAPVSPALPASPVASPGVAVPEPAAAPMALPSSSELSLVMTEPVTASSAGDATSARTLALRPVSASASAGSVAPTLPIGIAAVAIGAVGAGLAALARRPFARPLGLRSTSAA